MSGGAARLRAALLAGAAMLVAGVGLAAAAQTQPAIRAATPPPDLAGLYSAEQLDRGGTLFMAKCASCHGGGSDAAEYGPVLGGDGFWDIWSGRPARRLYSRIVSTMPANDPGSLSSDEALALTGFIAVQTTPKGTGVRSPDALDAITIARPD